MAFNLKTFYEGAVCVVTGATSGNGEAVAKLLHKLGAEVHGIGRNPAALDKLARQGIFAHSCDLTSRSQIDQTVSELPNRIDYVFILSGNAVVGEVDTKRATEFWASDYFGPFEFLRQLRPRITSGGGIGIVTSASAAMEDIEEILLYQKVKRDVNRETHLLRKSYQDRDIGVTLISMGVVATNIWERSVGLNQITALAVKCFIPGPAHYAKGILVDVAMHQPVSYPGVAARFAKVSEDGYYQTSPKVKRVASQITRSWFKLFPVDRNAK